MSAACLRLSAPIPLDPPVMRAIFAASLFAAGLALCASCDDIVFPSKGFGSDALREGEQLIDGPLVVGIDAVLHLADPSGRQRCG